MKCRRVGRGRYGEYRSMRDEGRLLGKRSRAEMTDGRSTEEDDERMGEESEGEETTKKAIEDLRSKLRNKLVKKQQRKVAGDN